jgi:hypothetical protein
MASKGDDVVARGDRPPHGAGRRHESGGAGAMGGAPARATLRQRWLARLAFAAAFAAVAVVLLSGALRSITALLLGFAGLAVTSAAAWWFLANRGIVRWLACVVLVAAPVAVIVVYVAPGLLWEIALGVVLAAGAVAAGRAALRSDRSPAGPREYAAPPQRQPFVIMNPRSGGGKVAKFGLKDKAAAAGADVTLLEGPGVIDVAALARQAQLGSNQRPPLVRRKHRKDRSRYQGRPTRLKCNNNRSACLEVPAGVCTMVPLLVPGTNAKIVTARAAGLALTLTQTGQARHRRPDPRDEEEACRRRPRVGQQVERGRGQVHRHQRNPGPPRLRALE